MADPCLHNEENFVSASLGYLEDSKRYMLHLRANCKRCGRPYQFLGLPIGLNLGGAAISPDGQEVRLAVAPVGTVPQPLDGFIGYGIGAKLNG